MKWESGRKKQRDAVRGRRQDICNRDGVVDF
jgi:hypothetical protein